MPDQSVPNPDPETTASAPTHRPFDIAGEQRLIERALRRPPPSTADAAATLPAQVLQSYCDSLTSLAPRIALAWIWFGAADARSVEPQIVAGRAASYARQLRIERSWLTARGPVFRAIAGQASEIFAISERSVWGPWREVARSHGIRSVIALRLASTVDARRGVLVLYSDTEHYFEFLGHGTFRSMAELFSLVLSNERRR